MSQESKERQLTSPIQRKINRSIEDGWGERLEKLKQQMNELMAELDQSPVLEQPTASLIDKQP